MKRPIPALLACILVILLCILATGCRTAGPQVCLTDCRDCHIHTHGSIDAEQGKSLQGEVSPSVAASIAAQVADNVVAQNDATKNGDGGNPENASGVEPQKKPVEPSKNAGELPAKGEPKADQVDAGATAGKEATPADPGGG